IQTGRYRPMHKQDKKHTHQTDRMVIEGKSIEERIESQIAPNEVDVNRLFILSYPHHPIGKTDQLRDEHLYRIKKPMLFLSGTRDSFARQDLLEKVVSRIGSNAQIHWIQNGDHSFKTPDTKTGNTGTLREALSLLVDWLQ